MITPIGDSLANQRNAKYRANVSQRSPIGQCVFRIVPNILDVNYFPVKHDPPGYSYRDPREIGCVRMYSWYSGV